MGLFSIFGSDSSKQGSIKEMLDKGALIIDVRTPEEYASGHIKESVNIPLNRIPDKVNELKRKNKPIITCCRSGARSGMAAVGQPSALNAIMIFQEKQQRPVRYRTGLCCFKTFSELRSIS